MKKYVKKPLAIAVLMLTFGGVANIAHASNTKTLDSLAVSATKEVKKGGTFTVKFSASSNEIVSGKQAKTVPVFILKVSDTAEHSGWRLVPTGSSKGGYAYDDSGNTVPLHGTNWTWGERDNNWYINDSGNAELEEDLTFAAGDVIAAGTYHFTGNVEEYL
ncbi:adhesin [Yersinia frederiksenii]|nr:adhesin [Yersinia frederiksenii]